MFEILIAGVKRGVSGFSIIKLINPNNKTNMFSHNQTSFVVQNGSKHFSSSSQMLYKVAVVGAAGGIGQALALLLKQNPLVTHLSLYDIDKVTPGVAVDISHINTAVRVTGHTGPEQLACALRCSHLVLISAGVARKPGMSREDLFNTNATIICDLASCIAIQCPTAIVAIITNPVNSMVPIACKVLEKAGIFDPNRVLGVTTLDLVRSATFVGEINNVDPQYVSVPVIGGHSGVTIIPLLSQSQPAVRLCEPAKIQALTKRIQEAGTEVVKAKAGGGSATLSMAYAAARLANIILRALNGDSAMIEYAYVKSCVTEAPFFSNSLLFGRNGVQTNLHFGILNAYEQTLLKAAIPELIKNIKTGEDFLNKTK